MRRTFQQEEPASVSTTARGVAESEGERLPEQEARQEAPKHSENTSPLKGKLIRTGIILFSGLGIAALLVPVLTGVPLGTLLQSVDFKAAYSGTNLGYAHATSALKVGNLPAATDAFLALPRDSPEFQEVAQSLFPKLLDGKEYERAAQVLRHMKPEKKSAQVVENPPTIFDFLTTGSAPQTFAPSSIGTHMGTNQSLAKSLEQLSQQPNLKVLGPQLLSHMFFAASARELPALEKLAPTLKGIERSSAMAVLSERAMREGDWEAAWKWATSMTPEHQRLGMAYVLGQMNRVAPKEAVNNLFTLPQNSPEFKTALVSVMRVMGYEEPKELKPILQQIKSPEVHDYAIGAFLTQGVMDMPPQPRYIFELADLQKDPAIKAWTLVRVAGARVRLLQGDAKHEFMLKELMPRLSTLARQNPGLVPMHDQMLQYYMGTGTPPKQFVERYLAMVIDPATRASLKKDIDSGKAPVVGPTTVGVFVRTNNTGFDLLKPVDADKLTGLRK